MDYQKIQRKFRKEKKDIEKHTAIIGEAEQQLSFLLHGINGDGATTVGETSAPINGLTADFSSASEKISVNGEAQIGEGVQTNVPGSPPSEAKLAQNGGQIEEGSDNQPSMSKVDTNPAHQCSNESSNPNESFSSDVTDAPYKPVKETKTAQPTKEGKASVGDEGA